MNNSKLEFQSLVWTAEVERVGSSGVRSAQLTGQSGHKTPPSLHHTAMPGPTAAKQRRDSKKPGNTAEKAKKEEKCICEICTCG